MIATTICPLCNSDLRETLTTKYCNIYEFSNDPNKKHYISIFKDNKGWTLRSKNNSYYYYCNYKYYRNILYIKFDKKPAFSIPMSPEEANQLLLSPDQLNKFLLLL